MAQYRYYSSLKITDNLYCYFWQGRGNNCNSYLFVNVLEGAYPHVIIDPGHIANEFREPCFEQLIAAIKGDGFEPDKIGLILNTHSHPDHCLAGKILIQNKDILEPPFIAFSQGEYEFLQTTGEMLYNMLGLSSQKIEPSLLLDEGKLNLGKITLEVLLTPGHSPGSLCFYWPEHKVLITGDVVFYGSIGRTDFPGGSLSALEESIEKLSTFDAEYLLPGHSTEYGNYIEGKEMIERNFQAIKMFFA